MKKKLRLLLFEKCNRSCKGCCNHDWDLENIPVVNEFSQYDSIMLTGGEPMLSPVTVVNTVQQIRKYTKAPVYMYTAQVKRPWETIAMLNILDGITLTLHGPEDVTDPYLDKEQFKILNSLLLRMEVKNKSMRLNVFKGVDVSDVNLSLWQVKDNIEWIRNCPLPDGEELRRLK